MVRDGSNAAQEGPGLRLWGRLTALFAPTRQVAPIVIPLVGRWATWLLGLGILAFGGGSERSQALRLLLALGSLGMLALGSFLLVRLFGGGWPRRRGAVAVVAAIDMLLSLFVVWLEGGWSSAFYEFALTSVMLPSLVFGAAGAVASSAAFSLSFLLILVNSPLRPLDGSLSTQVAALLNPWIVSGVVAVIADLLRRLERATARTLELAASEARWRLAREIHDGVAQQSYMLALGLETAAELARREDLAGLRKSLPPLEKLARQALLEVRQYVGEGRPLILGERSLGAALGGLAREFETITGVAVEVALPEDGLALSPAQQNAVYRLAQESLANIYKHAEARQAWVQLRAEAGLIELEVADDGRGLDPEQLGPGFGLEGMRRRVAELGGTFSVQPRPAGGTCLRAAFPLTATGQRLQEREP